ncbi:hypothetical protein D9M71_629790 [compost metagenome]
MPRRMDFASSTKRPRKSSAMRSWRISREPAMHAWPWLWKIAQAAPLIAAFRSASSKTMLAPFPPSSSCTRLRLPAEASTMRRPVAVEPVKAILPTSGCSARRWPALWP